MGCTCARLFLRVHTRRGLFQSGRTGMRFIFKYLCERVRPPIRPLARSQLACESPLPALFYIVLSPCACLMASSKRTHRVNTQMRQQPSCRLCRLPSAATFIASPKLDAIFGCCLVIGTRGFSIHPAEAAAARIHQKISTV
jgi:hypothetical protein